MKRILTLLLILTFASNLHSQQLVTRHVVPPFCYLIYSDNTVLVGMLPYEYPYDVAGYKFKGTLNIPSSVTVGNDKYMVTEVGDLDGYHPYTDYTGIEVINIPSTIKNVRDI